MLTRISVKNQRTYYWWVLPVIPWPSTNILMIFFRDISCSPILHIPRTNDGFPRSRSSFKVSWKYPAHRYHFSIQQPLIPRTYALTVVTPAATAYSVKILSYAHLAPSSPLLGLFRAPARLSLSEIHVLQHIGQDSARSQGRLWSSIHVFYYFQRVLAFMNKVSPLQWWP
jgi:hypothetical protein